MARKSGTDTAAFAALLNDLRGPLNGVAATLSKQNGAGAANKGIEEGDLRKLNFKELAERFEHLSQVLPDALRCVQEVKDMQSSVQERLDVLEGRQQSEEAYAASLKELQEAIESQSITLQEDIKERMSQLRQVLDDREAHLLNKVREVEHEKVAVIERQREQCLGVLESMRAVANQAHTALAEEDPTTWLDGGRQIEEALTEQNAIKVEYGPSPDLRFGCTLTVDLQRRILEVIDFDEKKGASPGKAAAGYKGGSFSVSGLNQSTDVVLPDGTDYAAFRRSLLMGDPSGAPGYRQSASYGGAYDHTGQAARGGAAPGLM